MKHVYILGAGFSVPLGGPLFSELLTTSLIHRSNALNQSQAMAGAVQALHIGNAMRRRFEEVCGREVRAEYLDTERLIDNRPDQATFLQQVMVAVKRAVAAQCEGYLDDLEDTSERWKPFLQWFKRLRQDDCIITYNYDTAVERIAEKCNRPFDRNALHQRSAPDRPILIKLHGSVDWRLDGKSVVVEPQAYLKDCNLAMGVPGQEKALLHSEGFFEELLAIAKHHIEAAERVSIIGYSMPPSDHYARMFILDALAVGNKREVDLVLGPAAETITARRMRAIIKPVVNAQVNDHPMYAQDFLPNVTKYSGSMV